MSPNFTFEKSTSIGSGNGLVPSGNKPLPEPMLTQIFAAMDSQVKHSTAEGRKTRIAIYRRPEKLGKSRYVFNFVVLTVFANGIATLIGRPSAGTVMVKIESEVYVHLLTQ